MSESREHVELVAIVVNYIKNMIETDLHPIIQYDSADSCRPTRVIGNYIPDVYFWHSNQLIIGEAKTLKDFDRPHSQDQYNAYIQECMDFYGQAKLVISVPWQLVATAKNYFRRLKRNFGANIPIIIINEFGSSFEI